MTKSILLKKRARLERTKSVLKTEFIGINQVIDTLIDAISAWYLTPELQDRPTVINLWGLTGVGKTTLVLRLAEELGIFDDTYHFDLGEQQSGSNPLWSAISNLRHRGNGKPNLLILDEFQHARTLENSGAELRLAENRLIWQLLDSGIFMDPAGFYEFSDMAEELPKLRHVLRSGIRVENGMVVEGAALFVRKLDIHVRGRAGDEDEQPVPFIGQNIREYIIRNKACDFPTIFDLSDHLDTLDGPQSMEFLNQTLRRLQLPTKIDCTKSLVLVMGNLDEAYPMHDSLNPDVDADAMHEMSLKITVTDVKRALQSRFRNEQVARLGNTHILYPAFDRAAFEGIIRRELDLLSMKMATMHKLRIRFDESIHRIIYKEGVFPTQGARPVLSSVHHIVRAKLPAIAAEATLNGLRRSDILLRFEDNHVVAEMTTRNGKRRHRMELPHELQVEPLRQIVPDDMQAIAAVHEAGHAVAYTALLSIIPENIVSKTAAADHAGFVFAKNPLAYTSKSMILSEVACHLAGYVAEKRVYGADRVTLGSEDDLNKATKQIVYSLKSCGMGERMAAYHTDSYQTNFYVHDPEDRISAEAERWLADAFTLAEEVLAQQEPLLLAVADHLSDHPLIEREHYMRLVREFGIGLDVDAMLADRTRGFYRDTLKQKIGLSLPSLNVAV